MIKINAIGSSSSGNCIVISDGTSSLMLDAGLSFRKIQRSTDLNKIEAVLITHRHRDHCKAVPDLVARGYHVFMNEDTLNSFPGMTNLPCIAQESNQFETENWISLAFDVEHDVDCDGFLIQSKNTGEKIVYAVDAPRINYDFRGVNYWLVEANYSESILEASNYEDFVKDRVRRSHMSIENLIAFLQSSDLSKTKEIHLCHLSDANSDEAAFIKAVQAATGKPTFALGA